MKKDSAADKNLPDASRAYIAKLEALKELQARSERINAIRLRATAAQGNCMLALATELLTLKHEIQLSWEELQRYLGNCADSTTLFKISTRQIWIKRDTYKLICLAVNTARKKIGRGEITFPDWIDWRSID